ncbi:MAG: hypothetical protein ACRYGP_16585 [Janthinobacterium lividum]
MPSHDETHPLANDPPINLTGDDKSTLVALGLGALLIVILAMVGLRCEFHHFEGWIAYLRS